MERALEAEGEHEEAAGVAGEMITYNVSISACGNAALWQRALELFAEMDQTAVARNTTMYNAAISACENADLLGRCANWRSSAN